MIYYSSEVKQYSSDAATAIALSLIGIHPVKRINRRSCNLTDASRNCVDMISHPSVFVLSGIAMILILFALRNRQWRRAAAMAGIGALWAVSFAATYFISLVGISDNEYLEEVWGGRRSFMPLPPKSFSDLEWFAVTFFRVFNNGLHASIPLLAGAVFLVGAFSMIRSRNKELLLVISPVLFALLASGLHQYPFARRLLLFLIPALILYIAEGVRYIAELKAPYGAMAGIVISALLFVGPFISAITLFVHPSTREEVRPAISYIQSRRREGDILYVYYGSLPTFDYYKTRFGIAEGEYIAGTAARNDWDSHWNPTYVRDLEKLVGNDRVWILLSHTRSFRGNNEGDFFLKYLDSKGERLDEFSTDGASAYLYDLNKLQTSN